MRSGFGFFVPIVLFFASAACSPAAGSVRELHYGLTLAPTGIDPHVNSSSELGIPLASVYDTLVFRGPDGGFVPGLARSWEISADGLRYTFFLRTDVRFHDGTAFDAGAVKTNIDRILDPRTKSQKARIMIDAVAGATVVDSATVQFELKEPFAPLLDSLSQVYLGMASPAALEKWGADYQFHQAGTGPFRFVEYVPGDHLILERNPEYAWAPSVYGNKTAQVDRVVFRFYADPAIRSPALRSGEADVMGEVLPGDAADLERSGAFSVYPVNIPGQPLQFFLNTKSRPTDDPLVREALLAATDRKTIVQTVFGSYSPVATGPLTAATWGAAAVLPDGGYDPEKAEDLLVQAGWKSPGGGVREKDGRPLRLKVVYPTWGLTPQTAELLELEWKRIGVEAQLVQAASFSALLDAQESGGYNLISMNMAGTDPDQLRSFFRSDGPYNWSGFGDAELDALLDRAGTSGGDAERLELYRQAQAIIARECILLPIRDYVNVNVASNRVHDLHFSPQGWFPVLIDVSLS